ncbi:hypothetical protein NC652_040911 [Populus alba x Populus x berolinensis]|nr:hypothetical protein NC652_040911 [Populus alba x Populus x berolinensis]
MTKTGEKEEKRKKTERTSRLTVERETEEAKEKATDRRDKKNRGSRPRNPKIGERRHWNTNRGTANQQGKNRTIHEEQGGEGKRTKKLTRSKEGEDTARSSPSSSSSRIAAPGKLPVSLLFCIWILIHVVHANTLYTSNFNCTFTVIS